MLFPEFYRFRYYFKLCKHRRNLSWALARSAFISAHLPHLKQDFYHLVPNPPSPARPQGLGEVSSIRVQHKVFTKGRAISWGPRGQWDHRRPQHTFKVTLTYLSRIFWLFFTAIFAYGVGEKNDSTVPLHPGLSGFPSLVTVESQKKLFPSSLHVIISSVQVSL